MTVMKSLYLVTVKRNGSVKYRFNVVGENIAEAVEVAENHLEGDDRKYGEIFARKQIKDGLPVGVLVNA